jgi:hypothetical protein
MIPKNVALPQCDPSWAFGQLIHLKILNKVNNNGRIWLAIPDEGICDQPLL